MFYLRDVASLVCHIAVDFEAGDGVALMVLFQIKSRELRDGSFGVCSEPTPVQSRAVCVVSAHLLAGKTEAAERKRENQVGHVNTKP